MEVGEGDLALVRGLVAESGDEKQVVGLPGGTLGLIEGGAFLNDEMAENAAQDDDGQFLFFELDEKDAPRLVCDQRAKLLDLFDLDSGLGIETEFFRLIIESEVVE